MNRRKLKKSLKKAQAAALQNLNEHLKRENLRLKRRIKTLEAKEAAIVVGYERNIGTIARLYGEAIEGYKVVKIPVEELDRTRFDYDVKCSIEDGKYIICVLPKVDPEAT